MSIVSAKALNSTIGKEDFVPFDILLSKQVDSLIENINQSTDSKIKADRNIKKIIADVSATRPIIFVGQNTGDSVSVEVPCDGSFYITGGLKKKTVSVYINEKIQSLGSFLNTTKQQKVKECLIYFKAGDTIRVVVNDEYEQATDGYSYFNLYAYLY